MNAGHAGNGPAEEEQTPSSDHTESSGEGFLREQRSRGVLDKVPFLLQPNKESETESMGVLGYQSPAVFGDSSAARKESPESSQGGFLRHQRNQSF